MQTFCQWLVIVFLSIKFLGNTYTMFNGRKALEPLGFSGFIGIVIFTILGILTLLGAGTFKGMF